MSTEDNALAPSEIEAKTDANVEKEAEKAAPESEEDGKAADDNAEADKAKGKSDEDGNGADGEAQKKPNRVSAKDRIAELTRKTREAEKRAKLAEEKLKAYEAPKPKRSDFKDDDEFEAERAKWAAKAAREDEAKHDAQSAKSEADAAKAETWNAQREEIKSRHPDFDEVIAKVPASVFTQAVADAVMESEMAADVAYVLASDLTRAREFAALTPLQMGREIGRIEAELAPKPRKLSSAPPPVETVGTKGPGNSADPSKMSMDEYVRWRKSQKD